MQLYYLYALGAANSPREIVVKEDVNKLITHARKSNQMLFLSYYLYDEEAYEHLKIRKTIAGYQGTFYLDKLIFDIDDHGNKLDFNHKKMIVMEFINTLMEEWKLSEDSIRIWFSGRGFHIETPDFFGFHHSNLLPIEIKSTIEKWFDNIDSAPTVSNGMLRAPFTINPKVNLYKTPFDYLTFRSIKEDELKQTAINPKPRILPPLEQIEIFHYDKIEKSKPRKSVKATTEDFGKVVTCVQKMFVSNNQDFRHQRILPIGSTFRRNGMPIEATTLLLKDWVKRQSGDKEFTDYEVERIVKGIYEIGYSYGCDNKFMKELCDPKCMFYAKKNYTMHISTSEQIDDELRNMINNGFFESGIDLNKIFNLGKPFMMMPQDIIVIWGDSGLGKSAFVQNLSIKLNNKKILYMTLEVPRWKMHRRAIQIAYNMNKKEVLDYITKDKNFSSEKLSHIKMVDTPPFLSNIEKLVLDSQAEIVIVDTLQRIELDDTSKKGYYGDPVIAITKKLRSIAKTKNIIMIIVHHVSKNAVVDQKGKRKKLTLHSGMGASYLEQDADTVIAIEGDADDNIRDITALKGRDDTKFAIKTALIVDTFKYIQLK